jgi:Fe-S-cluster containining protein
LVTLTGTDVVHLSVALGLSAKDLLAAIDFYVLSKREAVPEGLRHIPQVNTERGPAFVALRKQRDGDCIFLRDNLCMIHAIRPSVCTAFPFVFKREGSDLAWGLNAMKDICPGLGKGTEVPGSEFVRLGTETLTALSLFAGFVEDWNNKTKKPTAVDFLESVLTDPRFAVQ